MTPTQEKYLQAVKQYGSIRNAARNLGLHESSVRSAIRLAAKSDPALHTHRAPPGYNLRGASTLLNSEGNVVQQWVKTQQAPDPEALIEIFRAALQARPLPKKAKIKVSKGLNKDLLCSIPMGDPHVGLLSWAVETGQDFDLKICEQNLVGATERLVDLAPPSEQCVLINLGDFFHADGPKNETTAGTKLDVDSRYAKVLEVGVRIKISCIDACLAKFGTVHVKIVKGNHDSQSALALSLILRHHYGNNPRVVIDRIPQDYQYLEFGKCLLGMTHGNLCKSAKLPGIMAVDMKEAWGRTEYRYWTVGHVHHSSVEEHPGCLIETHRTLAARDAWTHSSGYRSGRSMVCDVLHRDWGFRSRYQIGISEIESLVK